MKGKLTLPAKLKNYKTGNYLFYIGLLTPDSVTPVFSVSKKQVFDVLSNIDPALYEVLSLQRHVMISFIVKPSK